MKKILLLLSVFSLLLLGNIDKEIEAIQKANNSQRFKLMNAFKKKIIKMKAKERLKAIRKLQLATKNKKTSKAYQLLQKKMRAKHKKTKQQRLKEQQEQMILNQEHSLPNEGLEYEIDYDEDDHDD